MAFGYWNGQQNDGSISLNQKHDNVGYIRLIFFSSFSFYRLTALDSQEASTAVSVTWVTTCISFHANSFSVIKVIRTDGFSVIIHYRNLMIKDEFLWMLINNPEGQKQQCRQTEETSQQERLFVNFPSFSLQRGDEPRNHRLIGFSTHTDRGTPCFCRKELWILYGFCGLEFSQCAGLRAGDPLKSGDPREVHVEHLGHLSLGVDSVLKSGR